MRQNGRSQGSLGSGALALLLLAGAGLGMMTRRRQPTLPR